MAHHICVSVVVIKAIYTMICLYTCPHPKYYTLENQ